VDIAIFDRTNKVCEKIIKQIEDLLNFAADFLNLPKNAEMSVTFMNDDDIRGFNHKYRLLNLATDVLSFALEEVNSNEPTIIFANKDEQEILPRNLGDIMISVDRAMEQAIEYGHSLTREFGFLAIHGFLHINGYDHFTLAGEEEMFALQKEILNAYGLQRE